MFWSDAYDARDLSHPDDSVFEALSEMVDDEIRLVASPVLYHEYKSTVGSFALLVTDAEVVIGKSKMFGGVKIVWSRPIRDFQKYAVGLYLDGGPLYEVYQELRGGIVRFAFETSDAAEAVAEYISAGVGRAKALSPEGEAADPARAKLYRSMDVSRSEPREGDEGKFITAADIEAIALWMDDQFTEDNYRAIWGRRLQLGYGLSKEGVDKRLWFWVNALPALSAIRLGLKDHGLVSTCAGYADIAQDYGHEDETQAMAEINAAIFG